jgi:hypothetical protein
MKRTALVTGFAALAAAEFDVLASEAGWATTDMQEVGSQPDFRVTFARMATRLLREMSRKHRIKSRVELALSVVKVVRAPLEPDRRLLLHATEAVAVALERAHGDLSRFQPALRRLRSGRDSASARTDLQRRRWRSTTGAGLGRWNRTRRHCDESQGSSARRRRCERASPARRSSSARRQAGSGSSTTSAHTRLIHLEGRRPEADADGRRRRLRDPPCAPGRRRTHTRMSRRPAFDLSCVTLVSTAAASSAVAPSLVGHWEKAMTAANWKRHGVTYEAAGRWAFVIPKGLTDIEQPFGPAKTSPLTAMTATVTGSAIVFGARPSKASASVGRRPTGRQSPVER